MKQKYRITHYIPLIAIMIASLAGFYFFPYDLSLRVALTISTGLSYFVWGLIHHYIRKDLSIGIVVEYLVICVFGVSAILTIIK